MVETKDRAQDFSILAKSIEDFSFPETQREKYQRAVDTEAELNIHLISEKNSRRREWREW